MGHVDPPWLILDLAEERAAIYQFDAGRSCYLAARDFGYGSWAEMTDALKRGEKPKLLSP